MGLEAEASSDKDQQPEQRNKDTKILSATPVPKNFQLSPISQDHIYAASQLAPVIPLLAAGGSLDVAIEIRKLWNPTWEGAIERGLNPKAVASYLLAFYYYWMTDEHPDWGMLGRLVARWKKLALYGLDEALSRGIEPPWAYAMAVCRSQAMRRET